MLSKLEERNNEIIQELKDQGYANRKINYEEFLRIYEPYKEEMSEKEFALLLGIFEDNFEKIKYNRTKAIILKDKEIEDKLISEIREELIKQGYANKKINYEEFLKLYEPYRKKISERNFAKALGLSIGSYNNLKYKKFRTMILKDRKKEEELINEIRDELIAKGYAKRKIDYEEFLKLYEPYKARISEKSFAKALGLSERSFYGLKYSKAIKKKAIILKDKWKVDKLISEIRNELIKKGYANRKIDYEEFLKLYEPYKEKISESNFARALGLLISNFDNLKFHNQKVVILENKEIIDKIIGKIREKLIKQGYANKKIDYEEFLKLYEPYKEKISEINFARALGILEDNFRNDEA